MYRDIEAEDTAHYLTELAALRSNLFGLQAELLILKFVVHSRKYAVDQPRVPAGSADGGRWTNIAISVPGADPMDGVPEDRVRVAQNGPFRPPAGRVTSRINGRLLEGTPPQMTKFAAINSQAAAATAAVRQYDRNWRPPSGMSETIEGEIIDAEARLEAANARLRALGDPEVRGEAMHACFTRGGELFGWKEGGAGSNIRTVEPPTFHQTLTRLMMGATETAPPGRYNGQAFLRADGTEFGIRWSRGNGLTIDVFSGGDPIIPNGMKVHQK